MPPLTKPRSVNLLEKLTRNSYPGILCGIVILILTGLPGSVFPRVKPIVGLDKVVHASCMPDLPSFAYGATANSSFPTGSRIQKKAMLITLVISIAYGGLTELMQEYLVPSRTGDWFDFLADAIGTLSGVTLFPLFFRHKK